ncbi:hypothetical protein [Gimesia aquarii]|uniref:Zinc finger/thioredoxin putative domain-containing protein n=1 Tax=Gimesia aquarii TaxID=2527964 RepID=A0A517WQK7_9PLAN|nr:hypothetical protein [Gimesia aquarii]QDU07539.1 hypothetical protein V202x_08960 [Gimesia aquarii]
MTISVQCDECFQNYNVRDERAGQTLKCKSCGAKIRVPAADEEIEDLYEDYEEPSVPTRRKKKPASAKKKKKSKKAIEITPGKVVKKIFGCLAILLGLLMLFGAIRVLFTEGLQGKQGAFPIVGFFAATGCFTVGKKWLTD